MGEDPVAVAKYFGSRDRINHLSLPERAGDEALRALHGGVDRRRAEQHVRGDEGDREGTSTSCRSIRNIRGGWTTTSSTAGSAGIRAAARTRRSPITSATHGRCFRPPWGRCSTGRLVRRLNCALTGPSRLSFRREPMRLPLPAAAPEIKADERRAGEQQGGRFGSCRSSVRLRPNMLSVALM